VPPYANHDEKTLAEILQLLKPSGQLILVESATEATSILAKLKLSGFVGGKQVTNNSNIIYFIFKLIFKDYYLYQKQNFLM